MQRDGGARNTFGEFDERPAEARSRGGFFIGRDSELRELRDALAQSRSGRSQLFLISGDPGIGKTYLVEKLSEEAAESGSRPAWGRALEGGAVPPFWPWIQVIRTLARGCTDEDLISRLNGGGPWIAQIVPELKSLLGDADTTPVALESEHARFYLFDAIATFLRNSAAPGPLLVVLDDAHWVDEGSLLLLQFVTQELKDVPILSIALYRQTEVEHSDERASLLARLAREAQHIRPRGFDAEEIAAFVEKATGTRAPPNVVAAVHEATAGNPFFVAQLVRLLKAEGVFEGRAASPLRIPENVRLAVRRQLAALPENCRRLLSIGAVVGREMDIGILQRIGEQPPTVILEQIERAAARGLTRRVPSDPWRYAFVHALVRETLYDDLPTIERRRLHLAVGSVLEEEAGVDSQSRLADVAHHYFEAMPEGDPEKALAVCVRAGEHALGALAYEEAARHFDRAVAAHTLAGGGNAPRLCELLIGQGRALGKAGRAPEARDSLVRAAGIARQLNIPETFARAIVELPLSFGGISGNFGAADQELIGLLEEALTGLGQSETAMRARILARLSIELNFTESIDRRLALTEEAVAIARRSADPQILGTALTARILAFGTMGVAEQREIADEMIDLGRATQMKELAAAGHLWRTTFMLQLGNRSAAEEAIRAQAYLADALRQPQYLWLKETLAVTRALLDGRFAQAEAHLEKALTIGESCGEPNTAATFGAQSYFLRREQGRSLELEMFVTSAPEALPNIAVMRAMRAQFYADVGRTDEARWELERAAADDFAAFPPDVSWLESMVFLTEPAIVLRETHAARLLYDRLLPHATLCDVIGPSIYWHGPIAHALARIAGLLEDFGVAERHFENAMNIERRMNARPWLARTQVAYAAMLLDRGEMGDVEAARELIQRASSTAAALGMAGVRAEAEKLEAVAASRRATPAPAEATETYLFRNEGEYWAMGRPGKTFRLKDTKGLHYISSLLAHPGREFHALDLILLADGRIEDTTAANGGALEAGDTGEVLDQRARDAYRVRLAELREELEENESRHDLARAERVGAEIEALTEQLSSALGLGGRSRRLGSAAERARLNVTRAVRAAIRRIAESDHALGGHLERAISTGTYCSYEPRSGATAVWNLG